MKNILLAVDFTDTTQKLVNKALEIAERFASRIWIIHVVDTSAYYAGMGGSAIGVPEAGFVGIETGLPLLMDENNRDLLMNAEQKKLQQLADEIKARGFQTEIILGEGDALDAILEETKHLNIDLIVMGFHEHGFLYNTFVGSTAEALIKKTEVPVLIVPEEKQE